MLSYMLPTEDKPPPGVGEAITSSRYRKLASPGSQDSSRGILSESDRAEDCSEARSLLPPSSSPKHHNGTVHPPRKSTLHQDQDHERKSKVSNGPKHANLKRVSFGSSKGSMVETLVYETPVQEEPEINHFHEHNGRLPTPMVPVPDTDEGREKVRVSLVGTTPFPSTPGVLLLEPLGVQFDIMSASPAELLTAHTELGATTYHTQISTDSGWDNPFRPDGDLSKEADEIVELIKGGKPITPTPGQNPPALPGCERKSIADQTSSPNKPSARENGNAHSTPIKSSQNQSDKATVDVGRMTSQGPGDASQVEHVTLKKKASGKCCVLQ